MNPNTLLIIFIVVVAVLLVGFALLCAELRRSFRASADLQRETFSDVLEEQRKAFDAIAEERQAMLNDAREDGYDLLNRLYEKHGQPPAGTDMQERHVERETRRAEARESGRTNREKLPVQTMRGLQKVLETEHTKKNPAQ